MGELLNLVVDLDERCTVSAPAAPGVELCVEDPAEERMLAWIDDQFGGFWSSEARAGANVVARRGDAPIGFATFGARGLRFRWLRGLAREPGVGAFGPIGVAANERGAGIGRRLLQWALAELHARGFERALIPAVGDPALVRYYAQACGARVAERFDRAALVAPRARAVVLASGNGTNLQAVLDAVAAATLPIEIAGVVVNAPQARAAERARAAQVAQVAVLPWNRREESRPQYDARLLTAVTAMQPDIVLLLGWMHLLDERCVATFPELLNLHPAFLPLDERCDDVAMPDGSRIPAFRGAHAVRDALAAGSGWIGATVHAVTPATDRGPVVARRPLRVRGGESEDALTARLHPLEHRLVASAVMRRLYERA